MFYETHKQDFTLNSQSKGNVRLRVIGQCNALPDDLRLRYGKTKIPEPPALATPLHRWTGSIQMN